MKNLVERESKYSKYEDPIRVSESAQLREN